MDHKAWLWKKKPSEKCIVAADKVNLCQNGNEEIQDLLRDKEEMEREIKKLSEKLSSALSECNAKDDVAKRNAKMAKEALSGWEKVEAEAMLLKQQFDEVLIQKLAGEERMIHLDTALKECMQQLRFVREEKEQRIHDVVTKTSREFEKTRIILEENLANSNSKLSKLGMVNSQLAKALVAKERLIEGINKQKTGVEADFNALMARVEFTEKENASLKYEVRVLEKEVEIRNEEREFDCRTADSAHKQHLESSKKIAKLESECQRLRVLVRKRLPGPAALAKMKSEVELLGRDSFELRRRKSNLSSTGCMDFFADNEPDTPRRKINFLNEQLCVIEEENRSLKEALNKQALNKQANELQFSQAMYNHSALQLSQSEALSEVGSEDKVNTPGSRASVLFSEINLFGNEEEVGTPSQKSVAGASEIDLMDDFVEMEKLATLSKIQPPNQSPVVDSSNRVVDDEKLLTKKANYLEQTNLNKSIQKLIDLIEGIVLLSEDGSGFAGKNSETPGYTVRVFQWKTSELGSVLKKIIQTCNDLLTGKADLESFSQHLTFALDWVINHCFSLQDVSSMRDTIKKQFDWDETRSESEVEGGVISHFSEADKLRLPTEQFSDSPKSVWSDYKVKEKETRNDSKEEKKKLRDELANMETLKNEVEGRLQMEIGKSEALNKQIEKSEKSIKNLQADLQTVKRSDRMIQNQISHHIIDKTDVEDKDCCGKESETTYVESQLQLGSAAHENQKESVNQDEKQLRSDMEITTASEKLAECQETILNLGRQLKALASPQHLALSNNLVTNPVKKTVTLHTTLLDKMLAEDNAENSAFNIPQTKDVICILDPKKSSSHNNEGQNPCDKYIRSSYSNENGEEIVGSFMAIVPSKKKGGGGFLKKLLGRKKKK